MSLQATCKRNVCVWGWTWDMSRGVVEYRGLCGSMGWGVGGSGCAAAWHRAASEFQLRLVLRTCAITNPILSVTLVIGHPLNLTFSERQRQSEGTTPDTVDDNNSLGQRGSPLTVSEWRPVEKNPYPPSEETFVLVDVDAMLIILK